MNINDYRDTVNGIKATDSFKRKVINNLENRITDEKTKFRKPVIIALATCLAAALIIPVLTFAVIIPAFSPSNKGALAGDTSDVESDSNTVHELNSKLVTLANGANYSDDYYKDGIVYQELPDFNAENSYIISSRFNENIAGSVKIGTPKDKLESLLGKPVCSQNDLTLYAFGDNYVGFYGKDNVELAVLRKVKTSDYDNEILINIVKRLVNNEELGKVYDNYSSFFDYTDSKHCLRGFLTHSNNGVIIYNCSQTGETSIDIYSDFKGNRNVSSDNEHVTVNFIDKNSIATGMIDKINNYKEINDSFKECKDVSLDKSMVILNRYNGIYPYLLLRYNDNIRPDKIFECVVMFDLNWITNKYIQFHDTLNNNKILDITTGNETDYDGKTIPDLPKLTIVEDNKRSGGGSGFGYTADDVNYNINNLLTEFEDMKIFPVYKNFTVNLNADEMKKKGKEIANKLGLSVKNYIVHPTEDEINNDISKCQEQKGYMPDYSTEPTKVDVLCDNVDIYVNTKCEIEIVFNQAVKLPDEFKSNSINPINEQKDKLLIYLNNKYNVSEIKSPISYVKMFEQGGGIILKVVSNDVSYGNKILEYYYNPLIYNININGELTSINLQYYQLNEKIGDYPVITADEAKNLLLEKHYISLYTDIPEEKNIYKVQLELRTLDDLLIPYYVFYVETPSLESNGRKTYGTYYVPAVESKYFTNFPSESNPLSFAG